MAGITDSGLVIKRLIEIYTDKQSKAVELFQDLVQPGDVVDTSDSTVLGRLIALDSPSEADLWEAIQQVYAAFDPNSATGVALDNLVALAGITRREQTFTTASILVAGDTNTLVGAGSTVSSSTTGNQFTVNVPIALVSTSASGITVSVTTVSNSTQYTISYSNNTSTNTISFTSDASATMSEILGGLLTVINSAHPSLVASVVDNRLVIDRVDVFQTVSFITSTNLGITKVRAIGEVVASKTGPLVQQVNTIDTIATPMIGWDSVTNPLAATSGEDRETDEELRLRFRNAKFDRATNSLDSIYSALVNVTGVTEVIIYENDTSATDANGIPGHSFLPIVVGGLSTDIANAIWDNKPIGILSYGNTSVSINDIQGFPHVISFSRPNPVVIYISMDITTDNNFPANGEDAIRTALVDYFNTQFGTGDDVVYSRLYTPINSVPGHQVESLYVGTSPNPTGTSNIVIPFDSVASLNSLNIVIN